jgi:hypothetical protein
MQPPSAAEEGELDESIARIMGFMACSAEDATTRLQEAGMNAERAVADWMAEMHD